MLGSRRYPPGLRLALANELCVCLPLKQSNSERERLSCEAGFSIGGRPSSHMRMSIRIGSQCADRRWVPALDGCASSAAGGEGCKALAGICRYRCRKLPGPQQPSLACPQSPSRMDAPLPASDCHQPPLPLYSTGTPWSSLFPDYILSRVSGELHSQKPARPKRGAQLVLLQRVPGMRIHVHIIGV